MLRNFLILLFFIALTECEGTKGGDMRKRNGILYGTIEITDDYNSLDKCSQSHLIGYLKESIQDPEERKKYYTEIVRSTLGKKESYKNKVKALKKIAELYEAQEDSQDESN